MITAPAFSIGRLDRRVTLRYPTSVRDTDGGEIPAWVAVAPVWCAHLNWNSREFQAAQARHGELTGLWRIRYRSDVLATWRITDSASALYTLAGEPIEVGRREYLDLPVRLLDRTGQDAATTLLLASDYDESTNNSGNTTLTPNVLALQHTHRVTFGGAGSTTRILILDAAQAYLPGARLLLDLQLPATAAITVEVRNATAGGTLLETVLTDTSGDNATIELIWTGTAWQRYRTTYPA